MGEISEGTSPFKHFVLHEVAEDEKERYSSPSHSILKTPTVTFPSTSEPVVRTGKRLTFADGSEEQREGSRESTPKKAANGNGESPPKTAMVEVAVSPVKSIKVSPEAWKAHQAYRRFSDYPNETVKTDYTYSWLSPYHKREIVPGIPMRPNMSRPPLHPTYSEPARLGTPVRSRSYAHKPYDSSFVKSLSGRLRGLQRNYETDQFNKNWLWLLLIFVISGAVLMWALSIGIFFYLSHETTLVDREVRHDLNVSAMLHHLVLKLEAVESAIADEVKHRKVIEFVDVEKAIQMTFLTERQNCCHTARRRALRAFSEYHQKNIKNAEEEKLIEARLSHLRTFLGDEISAIGRNVSVALSKLRDELISGDVSTQTIHQIVNQRLKLYDSDKTALPDYALESAGGRIVSIRCTQPWPGPDGISFDPRSAIRRGMAPGECWAFQGQGQLVIQLAYPVIITGCSVEHIPHSIHPLGRTTSAPQRVALWGLRGENDSNPHVFGNYTYKIGADAEPLQHFPVVHPSSEHFEIVEFVVLSNHGYHYTCLYRVRIHGTLT